MLINRTIIRISTLLAGVVALLVMCLPPLSYGIFSYQHLKGSVNTEAEINSGIISNLINANPLLWHYEEMRLEALLAKRPDSGESESRRLVDLQGRLIAASDSPLPRPLFKTTHEVMDAGQAVARLEIVRSLQPLLLKTGVAALIGLFLGGALFIPLRILPIRALKKAEETLRESLSLLHTILENVPIQVFWKGIDLNYLGCNTVFAHSAGYSQPEDLLGKDDFQMCWREQAELYRAEDKWVMDSKTPKIGIEKQQITPDGQTIWVRTSKVPLFDAVKNVIGLLGVSEDINERKKAEFELRKLKNLESIGTLAGGIAHDFNNALTGLYGNIAIAKMKLANDHPGFRFLEAAEQSIFKTTSLTNQLLTFSKGGTPNKVSLSLDRLVEDVVSFHLSGSNVKLLVTSAVNLWLASVDHRQIEQVFANLAVNAREAMPAGGHLTIAIENAELADQDEHGLTGGKYLRITVTDEGTGIAPDLLDKIFDPYFTTKEMASGLGLATAYSIINKHGGHISVASQPDKGTNFTIYLPAT